jgi:hypothetical protein
VATTTANGNESNQQSTNDAKLRGGGGYRETTQRGTRNNVHNNQTDHAEGG